MGKGGEMLDQLQHERIWSEKLLRNIYQDFLNEDEIKSMLNNRDLWMDGEEVVKRLEGKKAAMEAKQAAEDADDIEEVPTAKVPPRKKAQLPKETE